MARVFPGKNDLQTTHPELAAQWHPTRNGELQPTFVTGGSHETVWWVCDKGHEWPARINNRVYRRAGCPVCAGKKAKE